MVSSFLSGAAGGATVAIIIKGVDEFSKTFKGASSAIEKLGKSFKIAAIVTAGGLAVMAKQAASFERVKISFDVMLGSAKKGQKFLNELAVFTKKTPFKITELEENSRLLLGMGIEVEKIIPTIKALGDVASGLNVPLSRLALNFGQVKTQARLTGREVRDFAFAGVPIKQVLAKNLNTTVKVIDEMTSKGQIGFKDVEEAFKSMTSEGGRFANLMERSMGTVEGKVSNLQDSIIALSRSMGTVLLPAISGVVDGADKLVNAFNNLSAERKKLVSKVAVGAGVGVIGAGAAVGIFDLLKGSKLLPMRTFETNPAAMGGVGGTAAKLGAGGILTKIGGSTAAQIALPALIANKIVNSFPSKEELSNIIFKDLLRQKKQKQSIEEFVIENIEIKEIKGLEVAVQKSTGRIVQGFSTSLRNLISGPEGVIGVITNAANNADLNLIDAEKELINIKFEDINVTDGLQQSEIKLLEQKINNKKTNIEQAVLIGQLTELESDRIEIQNKLGDMEGKTSLESIMLKVKMRELKDEIKATWESINNIVSGGGGIPDTIGTKTGAILDARTGETIFNREGKKVGNFSIVNKIVLDGQQIAQSTNNILSQDLNSIA